MLQVVCSQLGLLLVLLLIGLVEVFTVGWSLLLREERVRCDTLQVFQLRQREFRLIFQILLVLFLDSFEVHFHVLSFYLF